MQTPTSTEKKTEFSQEQFENPYPDGIQHHYWTVARHRILSRALRDAAGETLLDIGCGRGITVDFLRSQGLNVYGCELAEPPPITPGVVPYLFTGTDVLALPGDFAGGVTTILLLDVLEHLDQPVTFLRSCLSRLPRCRRVLITLPARTELWSNYDEYYGHCVRYTRPRARGLAPGEAWRVRRCGYFFHGLYGPGLMLHLLRRPRGLVIKPPSGKARWLHRLIGAGFDWEQRLLPSGLPGTSLLMVLQRD